MSEEGAAIPGGGIPEEAQDWTQLDRPFEEPAAVEPPEDFADGKRRKLDPNYVAAARVTNWIVTAVLVGGGGIAFLVFTFGVDWPGWVVWLSNLGILAVLVLMAWTSHFWPPIEYRRIFWRLDAKGIEIKRGVVWRHVIVVPRTRIQHTDVTQGPVQRRFGLATLVIHTAGTHQYEVNLEGLSRETAFAVRDALLGEGSEDGA